MKFIIALYATALLTVAVARAEEAPQERKAPERARIEVVFVLDTTGSMSSLIQAAKDRIWSIANTMATSKPTPDIKMGLVGYRDRKDAYVTKVTDLTVDLDAVYRELMGFQAKGGGDTPESVNQALHEAVTKIKWSRDKKTYRVIFLVGDAPPHMDYTDDVKYTETCKVAAAAGIIVNTIQCGSMAATTPIWKDIAKRAEGKFFRVAQSGGATTVATPFDKDLAALARRLDGTRVYYGTDRYRESQKARAETASEIDGKASDSAKAQRGVFNTTRAGTRNWLAGAELIHDVLNGKVKLADVKEKDLPEDLRKLTPAEREQLVQKKGAERKKLQTQIGELAQKREAHLKKVRGKESSGWIRAIYSAVSEQAKRNGIEMQAKDSE